MPELISPLEMANEEPGGGADRETAPEQPVGGEDLEAIRALVLQANPDVVPELVTGESISDLLASVEPARAAYARLTEAWAERREESMAQVPAGGGAPLVVDPERLPAAEKIRRGLAMAGTRKRKG